MTERRITWQEAAELYRDEILDGTMSERKLAEATGLPRRRARYAIRLVRYGDHRATRPELARKRRGWREEEPVAQGAQVQQEPIDQDHRSVSARGQALVMTVDDLIRVSGTDLDAWRVVRHRLNTWTTTIKGRNGRPEIVRNWQVRADLERRQDRDVAAPHYTPVPRAPRTISRPVETMLVVPDSQHGFRWSPRRDHLEPLHDRRACDLVAQAAERLQPDVIVLLGDMLDVAEWSTKYPRPGDLRDTTQPTIAEFHWWLRQIREASPSSKIVYVEGNHERRLQRNLIESAQHVADLTAVGDSRPALDIARLLGLDALDVEYVGPYGSSWYWHDVRVTHGDKVRIKGGATCRAVLAEATESTLYGHIHRTEYAARTLHQRDGMRLIWAASPGCLCRTDGAVPGVTTRPDWQQGIGVVTWDGQRTTYVGHSIIDGTMALDGDVLIGRDLSAQIAASTGWRAIARP